MYDCGGPGDGGWGAGWVAAMLIMMILLVVAVVVAVWFLVTRTQIGEPASKPVRQRPEQVLAERLARGEIDIEEYRARLAALRDGGGPG